MGHALPGTFQLPPLGQGDDRLVFNEEQSLHSLIAHRFLFGS